MTRIPAIRTVMTPFPYSVAPEAPISEARRLMRQHDIRHLPVTREREVIGIVSDRDIKLVLGPDFDYPDESSLTVSDVQLEDPYVVDLETPLDAVLAEMARLHIGSVVVTKNERLAGVLTVTDVCRCFAEHLGRLRPGGGEAA